MRQDYRARYCSSECALVYAGDSCSSGGTTPGALSFDETVKPPHAAGVGKHIRPQVLLRPPVVGKTIEMRNGERHRAPGADFSAGAPN
jgi:hypothetical protein